MQERETHDQPAESPDALPGSVKDKPPGIGLFKLASIILFGVDIFISYRRREAKEYALELRRQLEKKYRCFLDEELMPPGERLYYRLAARRSRMFVLVGTPGIFESEPVAEELKAYCAGHRGWFSRYWMRIFSINVAGALNVVESSGGKEALEGTPWAPLVLFACESETADAFEKRIPSESVVKNIKKSFGLVRAAFLLLLAALISAVAIFVATYALIRLSVRAAESEIALVEKQLAKASSSLIEVVRDVSQVRCELETARNELVVAQKEVGKARALAQEESLKVQGSAIMLQAMQPGNEIGSLQAAAESAKKRVGSRLPDEVIEGVDAALVSASYSLPLPQEDPLHKKIIYKGAAFLPAEDGRSTRLATASSLVSATGASRLVIEIWDGCLDKKRLPVEGYDHDEEFEFKGFSPNGLRFATVGKDGVVRISNTLTGWPITELDGTREANVTVYFSQDGMRALTKERFEVELWNASNGHRMGQAMRHPAAEIAAASFSSDGKLIATAAEDGTVNLWKDGSPESVETFKFKEKSGRVRRVDLTAVAVSQDGERIIAGDRHGATFCWLREKPDSPVQPTLKGFEGSGDRATDSRVRGEIAGIVFMPHKNKAVAASYDHTATIIDAESCEVHTRLLGHTNPVVYASYSSDGSRIVSAGFDGTARIWTSAIGMPVAVLRARRPGSGSRVVYAAFSNDRNHTRVATLTQDGEVRIWDSSGAAAYSWGSGERLNKVQSPEDSDSGMESPLLETCRQAALGRRKEVDELTGDLLTASYIVGKYPRYREQ